MYIINYRLLCDEICDITIQWHIRLTILDEATRIKFPTRWTRKISTSRNKISDTIKQEHAMSCYIDIGVPFTFTSSSRVYILSTSTSSILDESVRITSRRDYGVYEYVNDCVHARREQANIYGER